MEGGSSLEWAELPYSREGPWGLGGMEERGGEGAHEAQQERRTGHVMLGPLMTDQEVDARTVAEEVWFWDKSLKGETEDTSE